MSSSEEEFTKELDAIEISADLDDDEINDLSDTNTDWLDVEDEASTDEPANTNVPNTVGQVTSVQPVVSITATQNTAPSAAQSQKPPSQPAQIPKEVPAEKPPVVAQQRQPPKTAGKPPPTATSSSSVVPPPSLSNAPPPTTTTALPKPAAVPATSQPFSPSVPPPPTSQSNTAHPPQSTTTLSLPSTTATATPTTAVQLATTTTNNPPEIQEEQPVDHQQQKQLPATTTTGSNSSHNVNNQNQRQQEGGDGGGNWGWGGKLSGWGRTFVQDMSTLADSFQQHVLQDLVDGMEEDDEKERNITSSSVPGGTTSTTRQHVGGMDSIAENDDIEVQKTRVVLDRLASKGEDPQLAKITEAVDGSVEKLGQTFTSLLSWGGQVAAPLASKASELSSNTRKDLLSTAQEAAPAVAAASNRVAKAGARATHTLGQTFGAFSNAAKELLLDGVGVLHNNNSSNSNAGNNAGSVLSFEECFNIYGGHQAEEELLTLSNDCSRLCNRVRAVMEEPERLEVDRSLTVLAPLFNESLDKTLYGDGSSSVSGEGDKGMEALSRGHAMVADLCIAACNTAADLGVKTTARISAAASQNTSTSTTTETTTTTTTISVEDLGLNKFTEASSKHLAELASVCLERLLALARSLNSQLRYGRPSNDGIHWDGKTIEDIGLLLREQGHRMWKEIQTVVDAFVLELENLAGLAEEEESLIEVALAAIEMIKKDGGLAECRVEEGFRGLMYVVWQQTCLGVREEKGGGV